MNPTDNLPKEHPIQKTYHDMASLIAYWVTDLEDHLQEALRYVQAGDLNKAHDILMVTQEYLNVLEILHKTILDIRHYRG